jgi:hypothetical protein
VEDLIAAFRLVRDDNAASRPIDFPRDLATCSDGANREIGAVGEIRAEFCENFVKIKKRA